MISGCEEMQALFEAQAAPAKVPKVTGTPARIPVPGVPEGAGWTARPFNVGIEMRSGLYLRLPRVQGANSFAAFEEAAASGLVDLAKAQAAITSLKAGYVIGLVKLGVLTMAAPWEVVWGFMFGPTEANKLRTIQVEQYKQVGKFIDAWSTTLYGYAKAGVGGAGQAYSWEEWAAFGDAQADQMGAIVGAAWSISAFKNLTGNLRRAGEILPNPSAWPTWAKLLVGLGVVAGGLYAVNTITQAKRVFLPGANHG